jgi:hypothetical protein
MDGPANRCVSWRAAGDYTRLDARENSIVNTEKAP